MSSDHVATDDPPEALPRGTRLGELEVLGVLGIGGFGIVYRAFDHGLQREVAVKEYMPQSLAGRTATLHVSLRSGSDAETFALGLRSFVNEARLLARFDHPALLKVHRFWEANDTAYMAMPLYHGPTLRQVRGAMDQPPAEAWLRSLLDPLLGALSVLHQAGVYHRDIAPDNIVLEGPGRPVLLDFGAARHVIAGRTQTLTAIVKPAYAPIEQYAEGTQVRQGPWTDLYGLGATLHFLLRGRPPVPSTARAVHDDQPPLAGQGLADCSPAFLAAIDWMLAPRPGDRPQSVAALREVLAGRAAVPAAPVVTRPAAGPGEDAAAASASAFDRTVLMPRTPRPTPAPPPRRAHRLRLAGATLSVMALGAGYAWWPGSEPAASAPEPAASAVATTHPPVSLSTPAASEATIAVQLPAVAAAVPVLAGEQAASTMVATPGAASAVPRRAPRPRSVPPPARPASVSGPETVPAPAPDHVLPASAAAAPALAASAAPPSPSQQCGRRVLLALSLCMERQCRRPEQRQHPDCLKWRAELDRLSNPQQ